MTSEYGARVIHLASLLPYDLDVKRLNVPFTVESECPACGKTHTEDLTSDNFLPGPSVGSSKNNLIYCYCSDCNVSWQFQYELELMIKIVGRKS